MLEFHDLTQRYGTRWDRVRIPSHPVRFPSCHDHILQRVGTYKRVYLPTRKRSTDNDVELSLVIVYYYYSCTSPIPQIHERRAYILI